MRRTSGPEYKIGKALLGGFNGVTSPPLNVPWDTSAKLFPEHVFYVGMAALILCYVFCAWLVHTHFGRVCVAIRENELRAELLGYDIRLQARHLHHRRWHRGGGRRLFCNGVGRVTPDVFSLYNAALAIIWVIVGGRGTLIGPVLGAFGLFYLTSFLGTQGYSTTTWCSASSSSPSCCWCRGHRADHRPLVGPGPRPANVAAPELRSGAAGLAAWPEAAPG
jgi:hypothetical protein